jgi:hypothetical protein
MSKAKFHKEINRRFYKFMEETYPHYTLDFNEGGGRVYILEVEVLPNSNIVSYNYDMIYYQNEHYVEKYANNWEYNSLEKKFLPITIEDEFETKAINSYIKNIIIDGVIKKFPEFKKYEDEFKSKIVC